MRLVQRTYGFTLVEVLVAMCLLGIVGVMSWRALDFVVTQRQSIDRDTESIVRIVRVLSQIERDIAQRAPDAALPARTRPSFMPASISVTSTGSGNVSLEILRFAPAVDGAARVQRVVYRIDESTLTRSASPAGTGLPVAPVNETVTLLPEARWFAVRAFAGGSWWRADALVSGAQPAARVTGLEVGFESTDGERFLRVFAL